jgi:hypothetical protein
MFTSITIWDENFGPIIEDRIFLCILREKSPTFGVSRRRVIGRATKIGKAAFVATIKGISQGNSLTKTTTVEKDYKFVTILFGA